MSLLFLLLVLLLRFYVSSLFILFCSCFYFLEISSWTSYTIFKKKKTIEIWKPQKSYVVLLRSGKTWASRRSLPTAKWQKEPRGEEKGGTVGEETGFSNVKMSNYCEQNRNKTALQKFLVYCQKFTKNTFNLSLPPCQSRKNDSVDDVVHGVVDHGGAGCVCDVFLGPVAPSRKLALFGPESCGATLRPLVKPSPGEQALYFFFEIQLRNLRKGSGIRSFYLLTF